MASAAAIAVAESIINGEIAETARSTILYLRVDAGFISLPHVPVTAVTAVSLEGVAVASADYEVEAFGLRRDPPYLWAPGTYTITYTTGWETGYEPSEVSEALTLIDEWLDSNPQTAVNMVSVGSESVQYAGYLNVNIPPVARAMLKRWARHA